MLAKNSFQALLPAPQTKIANAEAPKPVRQPTGGFTAETPTSMRRINGGRSSKTIKRLALALPAISVSETDARNGKIILITN